MSSILSVETRIEMVIQRLESACKLCTQYELDGGYAESAGYSRSAMSGSAEELRQLLSEINSD